MKYFACGILFLLSALALPAQSKLAYKDVFDRNAGLNHATSCMVEDREGFFWIGTHNGLYRFDGSQAREIRFWPDDSTAVHSRMVFSLVLDRTNDFLWIGSGNGVFKYHLHSGKSEKIAAEWFFPKGDFKFPQCRLIYQDRQGELWAHFAVSGLGHLKDGGKAPNDSPSICRRRKTPKARAGRTPISSPASRRMPCRTPFFGRGPKRA
ncbi:MAG: hypothetical protein IPG32_19065 [Saprospirales bacterium]|nr:hypothetical protein [Saprospirales bacterium]